MPRRAFIGRKGRRRKSRLRESPGETTSQISVPSPGVPGTSSALPHPEEFSPVRRESTDETTSHISVPSPGVPGTSSALLHSEEFSPVRRESTEETTSQISVPSPGVPGTSSALPHPEEFFFVHDNFGKSEGEGDYRRDIYVLSKILTYVHVGTSISDKDHLSKLELWSHLVNLATTGSRVCAATGRMDEDEIKSVIFTTNISYRGLGISNSLNAPSVRKVSIRRKESVERLLRNSDIGNVKFEDHITDIASVINFVLCDNEQSDKDLFTSIFGFFIRRAAEKSYSRIQYGELVWSEHPIRIIHNWYNCPANRELLPQKTFVIKYNHRNWFMKVHLLPEEELSTGNYTISGDNVQLCTKVLNHVLSLLVSRLSKEQPSGKRKYKVPDLDHIYDLEYATYILDAMLKYKIIDHLISPSLLVKKFKNLYDTGHLGRLRQTEKFVDEAAERESRNKDGYSQSYLPDFLGKGKGKMLQGDGNEDDSGEGYLDEDNLDEEEAAFEVNEYSSQRIIHHLQNLNMIRHASEALMDLKRRTSGNKPKFSVEIVDALPPLIEEPDGYYAQFLNRYKEKGGEKAISYIKTRRLDVEIENDIWRRGFVHAEAGIMGVACSSDPTSMDLRKRMETDNIPIAVGKKCCYCCYMLADLLNKAEGSPRFLLRGTHATIFSWMAPPGIPANILFEIRNRLLIVLNDKVEKEWSANQSVQTSPALSERRRSMSPIIHDEEIEI